MDEKLSRLIVSNQFRLLNQTQLTMGRADSKLTEAIVQIARLISSLPPPGDLFRERRWREMLPIVEDIMAGAVGALGQEVVKTLVGEVKAQADFAGALLNDGNIPPNFQIATPSDAFTVPATQALNSTSAIARGAQAVKVTMPPNIYAVVRQTAIASANLERTFGVSVNKEGGVEVLGQRKTGLSQFLVKRIDQRARTGFLTGESTESIAQSLIIDSARDGVRLGGTAAQVRSHATAVARTAVHDLAARVHQKVYDANSDVIVAFRFDASNDSRACPTCAALEGKEGTKDEVPRPPIHPSCRCLRIPVTEGEMVRRARGEGLIDTPGSATELVGVDEMPIKRRDGETQRQYIRRLNETSPKGIRWFAQPKNINGKRYYARGRDLRKAGSVADWLADPKTPLASLQEAMGGGRAGVARAKWFQAQVAKGVPPQKAYADLLSWKGMTNRTVGKAQLARFKPLADVPGASRFVGDPARPIARRRQTTKPKPTDAAPARRVER